MIYLDNAATGGFKTNDVISTLNTVAKFLCANPGRSGHALSVTGAKLILGARERLSVAFNCPEERVIFTKNCTEALNVAIFGTVKRGGHVITTVYEHNSVLRPLFHLKELGIISLDVVKPQNDKPLKQVISEKINRHTYMVVTTSVSNVTGEELPITEIGALCKEKNLLYVVDGAQGGGHIPLDLKEQNISILCLAGHKGLYGVMGSGALLFSKEVEIQPLLYGGTGTESFSLSQPSTYPERLEAGTLNLPAIAALERGVKYVQSNLSNFSEILLKSTSNLIDQLKNVKGATCYSLPNKAGIVSFKLDCLDSQTLADVLSADYDVAVRGGLHCAPLMHDFLGTSEAGGLVRASMSVQNTTNELNALVKAVREISVKMR